MPRWLKRTFWWAIDRFLIDPLIVPKLNAFRQELDLPPVSRVFRHWLHSPQAGDRLVSGLVRLRRNPIGPRSCD